MSDCEKTEVAADSPQLPVSANDESHFRIMVEASSDLIYESDAEGVYTFVNAQSKDILGYEPEELIGRCATDFMPPEEVERLVRLFTEEIGIAKPFARLEIVRIHKDGHRVTLETSGVPIFDSEGKFLGYRGISRDVTDRKEAERQLAIFQQFVESSGQGCGIADLDGNIVYGNRAMCRLCGLEQPEEAVGSDFRQFHPEEDHSILQKEVLPTIMLTGQWNGELSLLKRGGERVPVHANFFLVRGEQGSPVGLACAMSDITQHRKAQQALRRNEKTIKALLDAPTESAFLLELDGTIVVSNEIGATRLGTTVGEMLGTNIYDHMSRETAQRRRQLAEETIRTGESVPFEDERDGTWFEGHVYPVFDEDDNVTRFAVFARDITDAKAADQKLKVEQELLRRLLHLQDRERKLISHEIHDGFVQDVVGMKMMVDAAYAHFEAENVEIPASFTSARELLARAIGESRRMINELRPMIIDERGIIEAIEFMVAREQEQAELHIDFFHEVEFNRLNSIMEGNIFRIVQEAVTNVKRHSRCGRMDIRLTQPDGLLIEISDKGVGFDPTKVSETRFGLRGIHERARLFGGHATIESAPNVGTRITVNLPLDESSLPDANDG